MSDGALTTRVATLEADLLKVKLDLAEANIEIHTLSERMNQKHGVKHVDWIYRLLEHEPGLGMHEKKRLASSIVSILFDKFGDDLLSLNPEEFNNIKDRSDMSITHKGRIIIQGQWGSNNLHGLRDGVESSTRHM